MDERQRRIDNMLLQMIQRHFPSLPLSDEYTDWKVWLGFARAAYDAGALAEREACADACDEVHARPIQGAHEEYMAGKEMAIQQCARAIRMRSNA